MESLQLLMLGFQDALTMPNLFSALLGCILGTVVGVLPGIGPSTTIALMIPIAFGINPATALIMMTGVYLGAMYGCSLTSILLKVPGEAASMMTSIDGYEMAKQGRGASALAISAIGSFIGGTFSLVLLTLTAAPIARAALAMGPAEFFSLVLSALVFISVLLGKDLVKALAATVIGLLIGTVGSDPQSGVPRLNFGFPTMLDGIEIVVLIIGVFGVAEVFWFLSHRTQRAGDRLAIHGRLWLSWEDWKQSWRPIMRGSVLGFIAGVCPGTGPLLGTIVAYTVEKRLAKNPDRFGKGAIEAVAACETANNAAVGGAMIPTLTLGIPGSGATAILLAVLIMYGIRPGPRLMIDHPQVIWTVIASLYVSNIVLMFLNLPLIPLFVRIIDMPVRFLMPLILVICTVGSFSMNGSFSDVVLVYLFGCLGYVLRLVDMPQVALVIGAVLGTMMEESLRRAIILSNRDWLVFIKHPISAAFLAFAVVVLLWDLSSKWRKRRVSVIDLARKGEA